MFYENNTTASDIIDNWSIDRKSIFDNLNTNKTCDNIWSPISINNKCKCDSTCINAYTIENSCKGCIIVSRLFPNENIVQNKIINIDVGKYSKSKFIFNSYKFTDSTTYALKDYKTTQIPKISGSFIIKELQMMQSCEMNFNTLLNSFDFYVNKGILLENYFIISCIVENYLLLNNMPTLPLSKWLYLCNGSVNIISEVIDTFDITDDSILLHILLQLVSTLDLLSKYAFMHASPSMESIIISNKVCNYTYDSINIISPITIRLNPSCYSSININGKRLYYDSNVNIPTLQIDELPYIEILPYINLDQKSEYKCIYESHVPMCSKYSVIQKTAYLIGEKNIEAFKICMRNYGLPLFYSSLDIYSFLIGLLKNNNNFFFKTLSKNLLLYNIWIQLWLKDEYGKLIDEFLLLPCELSANDILLFLSKYHLRCDALKFLWNSLKNI